MIASAPCPFCADPKPLILSIAEKAVNASRYCASCGMTWRGPKCDDRTETPSPIAHAATLGTVAAMTKRLRAMKMGESTRMDYAKDSPQAILIDGQVLGMTAVLELICDDPHEG